MKIPSKELLGKVLKLEINTLRLDPSPKQHGEILHFSTNSRGINDEIDYINIYELMHLMIMWALSLNYSLKSVYINASEDDEEDDVYCDLVVTVYKADGEYMVFHTQKPTAFEAVVNACEWILKQKNSKPLFTQRALKNFIKGQKC